MHVRSGYQPWTWREPPTHLPFSDAPLCRFQPFEVTQTLTSFSSAQHAHHPLPRYQLALLWLCYYYNLGRGLNDQKALHMSFLLSGITALSYLIVIAPNQLSYIVSNFIVVYDKRTSLVPVTSSWLVFQRVAFFQRVLIFQRVATKL